ncbi:MAG: FadR family transcriptional regulator [Acidobacteria bacterium]|nr:FadR family transcriptional regulator [Acidobacteriota bacterium]
MLPQLKPVPRASLSDGIVEQITALIAGGSLKPGDRMPSEKELCRQFNVGRTSVREALRSLSALGVLESHAGDGTFVSANGGAGLERTLRFAVLLDATQIEALVEARVTLETQLAGFAARRRTRADLAVIGEAIEGMRLAGHDAEAYLASDLQFHLAIARAAGNPILLTMLDTTRGYLQTWIRETLASSKRRAAVSITEHRRILAALEARDDAAASEAMQAHLLSSSSALRRRMKNSAAR